MTTHSDESIVTKIGREKLIDKLKELKQSPGTRLASNQQYLIDHNIQEVLKWTMSATMQETVNLLVTAAINFHNLENDETQTLMTE